jgi:hypothetical protein
MKIALNILGGLVVAALVVFWIVKLRTPQPLGRTVPATVRHSPEGCAPMVLPEDFFEKTPKEQDEISDAICYEELQPSTPTSLVRRGSHEGDKRDQYREKGPEDVFTVCYNAKTETLFPIDFNGGPFCGPGQIELQEVK